MQIRVDSNRSEPDISNEMSEFESFLSVENYDKRTAENCRNGYLGEKWIVFKL